MTISIDYGQKIIQDVVATLTHEAGVYQMFNEKGDPLYVGKAKNLKKRVVNYTQIAKLPNRLRRMVAETTSMKIVTTHSEIEALLLESNLIKQLQPRYNILLKDDKSFPYILITADHPFPRLEKHRGPQQVKGRYFGPFACVPAVEEALILLQKVFLLRNCSDSFFANRTRPCLQYHIKRCSAPCVNKISESDYAVLVRQAIDYFGGKTDQVQSFLATKMHEASDRLAFEEAATYRDRIRLLSRILAHQRINVHGIQDADVIAIVEHSGQTCLQIFFFRQGQNFGNDSFFLAHTEDSSLGERIAAFLNQFYTSHEPASTIILNQEPAEFALIKQSIVKHYHKKISIDINPSGTKKELLQHAISNATDAINRRLSETAVVGNLLDQIATVFQMKERPARIEIYDNSHLQGTNPYGVMVVADEKGFNKKAYRKFAIQSQGQDFGGDDYAMMREVLRRRLLRASDDNWNLPDLMLIDGGLGQLNAVLEVIRELSIEGVTVVGVAKGPERNAGRERFFMENMAPFSLPENTPALHYLQRLRDEAHRFAIGTHRAGRQKKLITSQLDEISGIGAARKKALLQHFGSAKGVINATLKELMTVPGINKSIAKTIYQYFHER
ncbi:excinuclease ABC subunit UvrC [Candidatus Paracaedibacter symbiosus]|uniref:excinuclease ABC subunit UvrC n=1 Tax=Candidatus Paracaedibacter symbiosus TaxID=244582 RepID=UPI0005096BF9|nr:excinuclease ABC subunit UvrC [Candidatus Paracaedibacter symbiosus]